MIKLVLLGCLASNPGSAQPSSQTPAVAMVPASVPQQPQIINLNLLQALIAIDAQDMAGVFGFVPEANAAPALADYLLHNKAALKRFLKKSEKDLKDVSGVNEWEQQVHRYMLTIYASGTLKAGIVSKSFMDRVAKLSVAPALSLADITSRRKS